MEETSWLHKFCSNPFSINKGVLYIFSQVLKPMHLVDFDELPFSLILRFGMFYV